MIILDSALARRAAERKVPIRIGMIGAGFMARGVLHQLLRVHPDTMRIVAIANRTPARALDILRAEGCMAQSADSPAALARAMKAGAVAVTDDPVLMARGEGIDVLLDITGAVEEALPPILAAIETGKQVVLMNAELDGTVGPILRRMADAAGVVYTNVDGDQPGVEMNLFRFVAGLGVRPVLCGNIKGLHDPYRTPETQRPFAEKWGQKPAMVTSFADGTKISYEQAIVANGTGFRVARRGMVGPDFSGGDPTAPLVPLDDTVGAFAEALDAALAEGAPGLVDYVVGARPGPGVFVLGTHDDPRQQHFLNLYKLGTGPYYCFHTPYHLCHFEVPNSVARAALFGDAVLEPVAGPQVGVITQAKRDLAPGDTITEFGGFEAYGVAENQDVIDRDGLLPLGLALGTTLTRAVAKDQPLTFADVAIPEGRLADRLYAEQQAAFSAHSPARAVA